MSQTTARRVTIALAALGLLVALAWLDPPVIGTMAMVALAALVVIAIPWFFVRVYRAFLWKVGRRLAFSYFLIGVLPVPLLVAQLAVVAYLLSGFFLGHLYRDAARSLEAELEAEAADAAEALAASDAVPRRALPPQVGVGYYRGGRRIAGDERLPAAWPAWLATATGAPADGPKEEATTFVSLPNGAPTLAAAAAVPGRPGSGAVAVYLGSLEEALSHRSDVGVRIYRPDEPGPDVIEIRIGGLRLFMQRDGGAAGKALEEAAGSLLDRSVVLWGELAGPLVDLATGTTIAADVVVGLTGTPRAVRKHLFSVSPEVDASAWGVLIVVAIVLFWVYGTALVMAAFMIFGLSRAVNHMSSATAAVQQGDFAVRIPVRRTDQVGALQRSFNQMTENLEVLVATAAQKEILEKELAIARELQTSLIPQRLPTGQGVEFSTLFEPSAAIGGDYFDVLSLGERRLAVIIADVSGHGLPTGLRMAMLKAALVILVQEGKAPQEILRRLDTMVRADEKARVFVTATLALVDLDAGRLELTNAGHPPTYLLRDAKVQEIVLPGSPLGGLGTSYGRAEVTLEDGDVVVWLSDGLIEVTDPAGEPLGYEGVVAALVGPTRSAVEVRDRLLAAVERHAAGTPSNDDRTLVVMRYLRTEPASGSRAAT